MSDHDPGDLVHEVERVLARLATDAVPDTRTTPAPPWRQGRGPVDVRRFGRATPWLIAAVLLLVAGLGVGATVAFDASGPDRQPVGTTEPGPTARTSTGPRTTPEPVTSAPATSASTLAVPTVSDSAPESMSPTSSRTVPPSAAGGAGTASGPVLCTPDVMTLELGSTGAAAGSSYFSVHATNTSSAACVTDGFPGVALLDDSGRQILQADRDGSAAATIVVGPGEEITAKLRAANSGTGVTDCPVSPAFLFTLPDNTVSTRIDHVTPACSVTVGPFTAGDGS